MSKKKNALPSGWRLLPLGEVIALEYGKGFPQSKRQPGPYAVYGSNGVIDRADKYLLEEPTIIVGRKGSAGEINLAEPKSWPIDTTYYVQLCNRQVGTLEFAYYLLRWFDPRRFIETTTKPGLNRDRVYEQVVPVPPLPVQERIVQILQKVDEIRRKANDALDTVDSALVSLFLDLFGDPAANPKGWPTVALGDIIDDCQNGFATGEKGVPAGIPQVRMQNITTRGWFDATLVRTVERHRNHDRYLLRDGDVLFNNTNSPELVGKTTVFREQGSWYFSNHISRLRPARVTSEYLWGLLLLLWIRGRFRSMCRQWVNQASISKDELLKVRVPLPDERALCLHKDLVNRLEAVRKQLLTQLSDADALFRGLLGRAFVGELTAEWEAANAQQIAAAQRLHEALPRLAILALVAEAARRNRSPLLLTALMKYVFLLQMESNGRRRFYHFVPYHYGPFAKEVYGDLEQLRQEGLITIDQDAEEEKTQIAVADPARVQQALGELPEDLRADIAAILDQYGELEHNRLLKTVYAKYPAYAKKSRLLKGARKPPKRSGRSS